MSRLLRVLGVEHAAIDFRRRRLQVHVAFGDRMPHDLHHIIQEHGFHALRGSERLRVDIFFVDYRQSFVGSGAGELGIPRGVRAGEELPPPASNDTLAPAFRGEEERDRPRGDRPGAVNSSLCHGDRVQGSRPASMPVFCESRLERPTILAGRCSCPVSWISPSWRIIPGSGLPTPRLAAHFRLSRSPPARTEPGPTHHPSRSPSKKSHDLQIRL